MIRIREIDHLVLRTANPGELVTFYTDVLGMTVERHLQEVGLIQLRAGRSLVDIVPVDNDVTDIHTHSEEDPPVLVDDVIAECHTALHLHGEQHRIDDARELHE